MNKAIRKRGMSLIELMIVIGILGVLFTAVYMFFTKGTEQFHFTRMQNDLATTGRLALEVMTDEIKWAGYMPQGGWTEEQWHPVEVATGSVFEFYSDKDDPHMVLSDSEHRNVFLGIDNMIHITDDGAYDRVIGTDIVSLQFNYYDSEGDLLSEPLDEADRDAVRHIEVKITLQDTYMGDVYQTVMKTTITPRNLGVVHNFDPLFYEPPPLDAKIVVNVSGSTGAHSPTGDQIALLDRLDYWSFTTVALSDDELSSYDYDSSGVDLIILRDMGTGSSHSAIAANLQAIQLPIIAMDPEDAVDIFGIGTAPEYRNGNMCDLQKEIDYHPIHDHISTDVFTVYDTPGLVTCMGTVLTDSSASLVTGVLPDTISGVSVRWEADLTRRRIHYCAPDIQKYTDTGFQYLYNVIIWNLPAAVPPPLGEEINEVEGFEGDSPGEVAITLWEDDLEGGLMLPDSTAIYTDFEPSGAPGMVWTTTSTGSGAITRLGDNTLEMERTVSGAFDRNIAAASVDLSGYNALTDDLYITVDSWKGTSETINAEDGVFLYSMGGSVTELVNEDFESLLLAGGDVEFWGDLYGRHRVHSPGWNNGTSFVTLDTRVNGNNGRARMIIEVDTSTLDDGTPITVYFRMSDHQDENSNYNSSTGSGDYVGWSLGEDIADPIEDYMHLSPQSYSDGQWYDREFTFTPPGTMPSTLYVIFSQYDNYMATSATGGDGISFDNVVIVADNSTITLNRVGVPSISADWQPIGVDLDDQAIVHGAPFTADYGIALSQYGLGPWSNYGMHWRDFEIGYIEEIYSLPGWYHGPVLTGGTDDWLLEEITGNHKWTLHANNPSNYSNSTDCWLETPEFSIPSGAEDAVLSFVHAHDFETNYDFGWVEVSTNGGSTWVPAETSDYNTSYAGHGAYSGISATSTAEIDLTPYTGQNVRFRFMFHSDGSVVRSGWVLDNFEATATVTGISIQSIGFKPTSPSGSWHFNQVDVYLAGVPESAIPGDGEWNKGEMTFAGTYSVDPPVSGEWSVIDLNDPFILPEATNLLIKMEMQQTGPTTGYSWVAASRTSAARWATSVSGDPTNLTVADVRPAFMIDTQNHGQKFVDADSTNSSTVMPLAFNSMYGDFEAIYLMTELGFSGGVTWEHGGTNDDWEFGAPLFIPDIDPALMPSNQNTIAGNDLTDDGYYMAESWNWLRSCPYPLADAAVYDSVAVSFDRCLRRSHNDKAFIYMAFTETPVPPTEETDWLMVKDCDYDDDIWVTEVIQLTPLFQEAISQGKNYYFIRFVLDSGIYAENGGWNIDNVGFYGRYAI